MPHQVSVFAENKPGKISRITEILGENEVNIRAITISDSGDYGIIKLILDKPHEGCDALNAGGMTAALRDVVAVKISDSPGGLSSAARVFADNGVNIEDACGFTIREGNQAVFIFQVQDVRKTEKMLSENGFTVLEEKELYLL